jgi:DNA-binding CsgD family transcriptional regulator
MVREPHERRRRWPRDTRERIRAVEDALSYYPLDGHDLRAPLEALRELLGTERVLFYQLAQRDHADELSVTRWEGVGFGRGRWRDTFDEFLRGRGVDWGGFNGVRPSPIQRDRVLDDGELTRVTRGKNLAIEATFYRSIGLAGEHTMRALICDGPRLLGWLGTIDPERVSTRRKQLLEHVLPAFRKRLMFEQMIDERALAHAAMPAVMEEIGAAAWLLRYDGAVAYANTIGRQCLERERSSLLADLRSCTSGRIASCQWRVTPFRAASGQTGFLVVEAAREPRAAQTAVDASRRFGLTPAQGRVLVLIARGASNATISAELGIAERTVETHVTAILEKAQVGSRAALIVEVFGANFRA